MKIKICRWFLAPALLALSTLSYQPSTCVAQGTAFTYQGQLFDNGAAANGSYALRFTLYTNATTALNVAGGPLVVAPVGVSNGLFTVLLDYGPGAFTGAPRWLQIDSATNSVAPLYVPLTPRQLLSPAPYAIFANTASNLSGTLPTAQLSGTVPSANLTGSYSGVVTFNNPGNSFSGSGAGLANVSAASLNGLTTASLWQTTGNSGTTPGANYLGTSDNQPLELHVDGARALRLEPNAGGPNVIGGASVNAVNPGNYGNVIGGGLSNNILNGTFNGYATIGGGQGNNSSAAESVIGGGAGNLIPASGIFASIPGGSRNLAAGAFSFAAGQQAQALNQGSFVWSDTSSSTPFSDTGPNQFCVQAQGGITLNGTNGIALNAGPGNVSVTASSGINLDPTTDINFEQFI